MATKQVNGSAVTSTSTRNDGGTVVQGGNIGSTRWDNRTIANGRFAYSPQIILGQNVHKALAGGTFATMTAGTYLIRRVSSTIAGVANTILRSGGSDFGGRNSIHKIETVRNTFLHSMSWTSDRDGQPTYAFTRTQSLTQFAQDDAARPTLAIPGELVYRDGSPAPIQDDYPAKTN